jgi:hypothetical protein
MSTTTSTPRRLPAWKTNADHATVEYFLSGDETDRDIRRDNHMLAQSDIDSQFTTRLFGSTPTARAQAEENIRLYHVQRFGPVVRNTDSFIGDQENNFEILKFCIYIPLVFIAFLVLRSFF